MPKGNFFSVASQLTSATFPVSSWLPNLFPFKHTVLCIVPYLVYITDVQYVKMLMMKDIVKF